MFGGLGLGFGGWGLGFWGLGFKVWGLGFRVQKKMRAWFLEGHSNRKVSQFWVWV